MLQLAGWYGMDHYYCNFFNSYCSLFAVSSCVSNYIVDTLHKENHEVIFYKDIFVPFE